MTAITDDRARTMGNRSGHVMPGNGYAVRVDWPGSEVGTVVHEFSQFATVLTKVRRRALSTERFWVPGPLRPLAITVVPIARAAFRAHRQPCAALTCPTVSALHGKSEVGASWQD